MKEKTLERKKAEQEVKEEKTRSKQSEKMKSNQKRLNPSSHLEGSFVIMTFFGMQSTIWAMPGSVLQKKTGTCLMTLLARRESGEGGGRRRRKGKGKKGETRSKQSERMKSNQKCSRRHVVLLNCFLLVGRIKPPFSNLAAKIDESVKIGIWGYFCMRKKKKYGALHETQPNCCILLHICSILIKKHAFFLIS